MRYTVRGLTPIAAAVAIAACAVQKPFRTLTDGAPTSTSTSARRDGATRTDSIRVHHHSGALTVLGRWNADTGRALVGDGTLYDVRRIAVRQGTMRIPLDSIALVETTTMRTHYAVGPAFMNI